MHRTSSFIGCGRAGEAVAVDPFAAVGVEEHLLTAAEAGLRIVRVVDTHLHADHISSARPLADELCLRVSMQ